jgi:hypothetical protein
MSLEICMPIALSSDHEMVPSYRQLRQSASDEMVLVKWTSAEGIQAASAVDALTELAQLTILETQHAERWVSALSI